MLCNILYYRVCWYSSIIKNTTFLIPCINFCFDADVPQSLDAEQKLLGSDGLISNYEEVVTRNGREARQRSATALEGVSNIWHLPPSPFLQSNSFSSGLSW